MKNHNLPRSATIYRCSEMHSLTLTHSSLLDFMEGGKSSPSNSTPLQAKVLRGEEVSSNPANVQRLSPKGEDNELSMSDTEFFANHTSDSGIEVAANYISTIHFIHVVIFNSTISLV